MLLNSNYLSAETYKGQDTDLWEHEFLVARIHKEAFSVETLQEQIHPYDWYVGLSTSFHHIQNNVQKYFPHPQLNPELSVE